MHRDQPIGRLLVDNSVYPYSSDDFTLLQAIARQVSVAHENASLKDRVDDDRRVRHDVIAKLDPSRVNVLKECPECGTCYDATAVSCSADRAELKLSLPIERTIDAKFGLAKMQTLDQSATGGLTQSGAVMGTAGYMAPNS